MQSPNIHPDYNQEIINGKLTINPCPLATGAYDVAELMFGVCIDVWTKREVNHRTQWRQIRTGNIENETNICLHRSVDYKSKFL